MNPFLQLPVNPHAPAHEHEKELVRLRVQLETCERIGVTLNEYLRLLLPDGGGYNSNGNQAAGNFALAIRDYLALPIINDIAEVEECQRQQLEVDKQQIQPVNMNDWHAQEMSNITQRLDTLKDQLEKVNAASEEGNVPEAVRLSLVFPLESEIEMLEKRLSAMLDSSSSGL